MAVRSVVALLLVASACRPDEPAPRGTYSSSTSTSTTPAVDWCGADDLVRAPAPVEVDGLGAVPVDVQTLEAFLDLDATAQTARAEAVVTFRVGPDGGMPILDLRQVPGTIGLDDDPVDPADFAPHAFTQEADSELRVLARDLPPCSTHTLALSYDLGQPSSPQSRPIGWDAAAGAVRWDFWMTDLYPGRYLEMWFPANLVWDRFGFSLDLALQADVEHTLITNADVQSGGEGQWSLVFDDASTALSPMLVLVPSTDVVSETRTETFADGLTLDVEVHRNVTVADSVPSFADRVRDAVATNLEATGTWSHGDRLVVYVWDEATRSMEYDGGTTTNDAALEHELFHSWYGRGVRPANGPAGWIDEAWDTYNTDRFGAFKIEKLTNATPPVTLDDGDPFSRITVGESYSAGLDLFGHLAFLVGVDELTAAMADFYAENVPNPVTTEQLDAFLYCRSDDREVADAFWRYVYGQRGPRDPATLPLCPDGA